MWTVSVASLSVVAVLCAFGVFHRAYKDNILQCIGMGGLFLAASGQLAWIWQAETTAPSWAILHVSMAIYAIGTVQKVALFHGRQVGWRWLIDLDRWVFAKQTAASAFDDKPHHHTGLK